MISSKKNIHALKVAGAQLWLDDFGTGYSGFLSLKTGVFDGIKIPREFVSAKESPTSTMLRQSITRIGKDLNMTVIAEGVEQCSQVEMLSIECIDYLQGYYFSQPLSANDFLIYAERYLQVD
ncbi:EAL domain-containing protein [Salmonella enterica subsp. enterica]|nr:EAL domain-containing protein [Salmonella enterica subsp. enterica]